MKLCTLIFYVSASLIILGLGIWYVVHRYQDCKKVGHTTCYCIMSD